MTRVGRVLAIWNPNAGDTEANERLRARLDASSLVDLVLTESPDDLRSQARDPARRGYDTVLAAGGDGTVHGVVNVIADASPPVALAVVPLGTGNDTARSLGIPDEPDEAVDVLLEGGTQKVAIDLLEAETEAGTILAINSMTAGIAALVGEETSSSAKESWGAIAYYRTALSLLRRRSSFRAWVRMDGGPERALKLLNLHIGNGPFSSGGFPAAPEADPSDGRMDVIAVSPASVPQLMGTAMRHIMGRAEEDPNLLVEQVERIDLRFRPEPAWRIDGEAASSVRSVQVRSGAIQVHVARSEDGRRSRLFPGAPGPTPGGEDRVESGHVSRSRE